ncbi:MAG TPA: DUF2188 domain-containing protein [Polyangiaceae bacterium]|nr:DUF2188 domain-containing protein [Polyangiaceae bacterium]
MPKPIVYEVAPSTEGWVVRMAGDSQSEGFEDKADAVARARQLAAREQAVVRVLTPAGRVEAEYGPPGSGART